jgi:hypothetical protein
MFPADPNPSLGLERPAPFPYWYLILMVTFALPGIFAFVLILLQTLSMRRAEREIREKRALRQPGDRLDP